MRILSFDIGIVNMAYCVIEKETKQIKYWEVFSLCNSTEIENCKDLVRKMDERLHILEEVDLILMERQPKCNPKMRSLASALRSYFIVRGMVDRQLKFSIKDYSPKHKLRCWEGPVPIISCKSEYRRRKKLAIFHCEQLMVDQTQEIRDIYSSAQSKKDDLADCFLQSMSFIMFEEGKNTSSSNVSKRKPTTKQMRYMKLSKGNIKYLLDEFLKKRVSNEGGMCLDEILKVFLRDNKRINECLNKIYGTDMEESFRKEILPDGWDDHRFNDIKESKKVKKTVQEDDYESNSESSFL